MEKPMKILAFALLMTFCFLAPIHPAGADEVNAEIAEVIQTAYVRGIQIEGDPELIRSGFDSSFRMFIKGDEGVRHVTIEDWISRIEASAEERAKKPKRNVKAKVTVLDRAGHAAVAKVYVEEDGKHIFTDYMSLYHFEDGWKIVAKIFQVY